MKKIILLIAITWMIAGCGTYSNQLTGIEMEKIVHPVSDSLDNWGDGDERVPNDFLAQIVARWGRGHYAYFAQRVYDRDGSTISSYRLEICKTLATGKDPGAPLGCTIAEDKSAKLAFASALKSDLRP
jgi:hypothetical protein